MNVSGLYQTVVWNKSTPREKSYGLALTEPDAHETLAEAMKSGVIEGKVIPYAIEPGHYYS